MLNGRRLAARIYASKPLKMRSMVNAGSGGSWLSAASVGSAAGNEVSCAAASAPRDCQAGRREQVAGSERVAVGRHPCAREAPAPLANRLSPADSYVETFAHGLPAGAPRWLSCGFGGADGAEGRRGSIALDRSSGAGCPYSLLAGAQDARSRPTRGRQTASCAEPDAAPAGKLGLRFGGTGSAAAPRGCGTSQCMDSPEHVER